MTVDGFLPVAGVVGGIIVCATLVYAVCYSFHLKLVGKLGAWSAWPLLMLYLVGVVTGFVCAVLSYREWQASPSEYGFYGDYDEIDIYFGTIPRRIGSFALLGVLSSLLFLSAQHAASTAAKSAKPKS